jgi:NDP-sugar pyrophosphorylase family protein
MVDLLRGAFSTLVELMDPPYDPQRRIWIPPETLQFRDELSGKSLEEKLEEGLVCLEGNVRLGRYVEVGPEVCLRDSNVDDGVDIGAGAVVERCAIRDGAIIGPGARLSSSYIGSMVEIGSTWEHQSVLEEYVAVGDEAVVQPGAHLRDRISIHPRLKIPAPVAIPPGTEVRDAEDVLRWL